MEIAGPVGPDSNPRGRAGGYHALTKAQRIESLKEMLWDRATQSERDNDRIAAINSLLNREDGMPVQKIVTPDSAPEWFIEGVAVETEEEWTANNKLIAARPVGSAD